MKNFELCACTVLLHIYQSTMGSISPITATYIVSVNPTSLNRVYIVDFFCLSHDYLKYEFVDFSAPPEGGYSLGELLDGKRPECTIWRSQDVRSGQRGSERFSRVLH